MVVKSSVRCTARRLEQKAGEVGVSGGRFLDGIERVHQETGGRRVSPQQAFDEAERHPRLPPLIVHHRMMLRDRGRRTEMRLIRRRGSVGEGQSTSCTRSRCDAYTRASAATTSGTMMPTISGNWASRSPIPVYSDRIDWL